MLVGITIDEYKGINPSVLLSITRKIGLDFVEITESVFTDLPNVVSELGKTKTGFHLPNFGDTQYDFSCIDKMNEINRLIDLINRHHYTLNMQYCLSHPPECPTSSTDINISNSILFKNLKKIKVPLVLENVPSLSAKQFTEFYSQAQAELGSKLIGQCYDAAHYFVRGEDPISILNNFNGVIRSVHLSDCKIDKDAHLPFGLGGELPIDEILNTLKNQNYDGIINLELLPRSISDLQAVINSYLKVLKIFKKTKYFLTKGKLILYLPLLHRKINK